MNADAPGLGQPAEARARHIAKIRNRIAQVSHRANSAHLGSSLSCVEILDAILRASGISAANVDRPDRARLVMSKGHAAMGFYASLEAWGLVAPEHLDNYLSDGSALWGHVTRSPAVPAIDVSTGSLGHGLSLTVGYAVGYRLRGWPARHFCVLSDGECDEGSIWEAALFAGHHRLSKVAAVVDYNKIQSLERVSSVLELEPFADKWRSFGWLVREVNGHDSEELDRALAAPGGEQPLVVIGHTVKGRGISRIEDSIASHYRPAQAGDFVENALA
jgi:transketolase